MPSIRPSSRAGQECADTWSTQRADALVALAKSYMSGGEESSASCADHYQVVAHVDAAVLTDEEGKSDLPVESVKRLTCDGSIIATINGDGGEPLSVGRKLRTIPTAIKRALWARDKRVARFLMTEGRGRKTERRTR